MEPFRPLVDHAVWRYREYWTGKVETEAKRELAEVVNGAMATAAGSSPVSRTMSMLTHSLAELCTGQAKDLAWPLDWSLTAQAELDLADGS